MVVKSSSSWWRLGARFDAEVLGATREAYRPLVSGLEFMRRAVRADLAYGEHPRQCLDVYPSDQPDAPVLVFVHGGGFVAGDKAADAPFYGNVGRYFAQNGFLAVLPNYRLAPTDPWPAGRDDVAGALAWTVANARTHGGDPTRVVLVGQSAGAAHVAALLFSSLPRPTGLRAVALMSGFYRPYDGMPPGPAAYFGIDADGWPERSALTQLPSAIPPLLLTVAELDPAWIGDQTLQLARALTKATSRVPRLEWLEGENHVSPVHGLGVADDRVGRRLVTFARGAT